MSNGIDAHHCVDAGHVRGLQEVQFDNCVIERALMPKLKTKSGAKKRFTMTGTGKVKAKHSGKRHGMIKRTSKFVREARHALILKPSDVRIVTKYMPYDR